MALKDINSRQAILDAVAEFDRLGRPTFLAKYGFGAAKGFFLVIDQREYDSKAIVGVAHGYQFPAQGPLTSRDFKGGVNTVQRLLESLGYKVRVASDSAVQTPDEPDSESPDKDSVLTEGTTPPPPPPPPPENKSNFLQTTKLVLEIVAVVVTIVGGIIALIWSMQR